MVAELPAIARSSDNIQVVLNWRGAGCCSGCAGARSVDPFPQPRKSRSHSWLQYALDLLSGCISTSVGEFREQCRKSLAHLVVLRLLLTRAELPPARRRRTRRGVDVRTALRPQAAVGVLRENKITLVYDEATVTRQGGKSETVKTIRKATGSYD